MQAVTDARPWAQQNFGSAVLGDRRRTRRLIDAAAAIAARPEPSFTQVFDWNDLRGFYRLCDRPEATLESIQRPHRELTRQALARAPLALILHDTTELDFTTHHALTGTGPVGDGGGRGFLQHNSLAVLPQPRQVLGLAFQQLSVRRPAPPGDNSQRRKKRDRESALWRQGIAAPGPPPEGCCWVDVADRGGDDYEALRAARQVGHHFLFRASQDRLVFLTPDGQRRGHLLDFARALPARGADSVGIPGRGGRPPRTAEVSLAAAPVWMPAPHGTRRRWSQPILAAWVIRIWEPQPPPGIDQPLEWVLLGSLPTDSVEQIKQRRDWYCCRWLVEVYHDVEKNGCREEARRFETAGRMEACLALLSVVAVRVLQLRCALEAQPEAPAEQVATAAEIGTVRRYVGYAGAGLTVRDFVRGVGRLGGFLGRKRDGEPGVRALWRGYQRLQDMILGAHRNASPNSGFP
jgi:hypothetical protein